MFHLPKNMQTVATLMKLAGHFSGNQNHGDILLRIGESEYLFCAFQVIVDPQSVSIASGLSRLFFLFKCTGLLHNKDPKHFITTTRAYCGVVTTVAVFIFLRFFAVYSKGEPYGSQLFIKVKTRVYALIWAWNTLSLWPHFTSSEDTLWREHTYSRYSW